jgi:hypothetical protein
MMQRGRRTKRGVISNKNTVIDMLGTGRIAAIQVCKQTVVTGPDYDAARKVVEGIDFLVGNLTGDYEMFHTKPSSTPSGPSCRKT